MDFRTDLAMESALRPEAGGRIQAHTRMEAGFALTRVEIEDKIQSDILCKPVGQYITMDMGPILRREPDAMEKGAGVLARILGALIPDRSRVLIAAIGNEHITPDTIGPRAADSILVTRHLKRLQPADFEGFGDVSLVRTGVLGNTGMESGELVQAACRLVRPSAVIAIDALAASDLGNLCCTVQLTDTGIVPGSGVGNHRMALTKETLGVDVIAIGVPTVVDLGSAAAQLLGIDDRPPKAEGVGPAEMILTPRDIDAGVDTAARLIAYGIDLCLHPAVGYADLGMLLG